MADSPDAILLKRRARRRLVGAVALVVLVVVIVPVILDQQPRTVIQPLTVRIPSQDRDAFETPVLPPLSAPRSANGETPQPGKKSVESPAPTEVPKSGRSENKGTQQRAKRSEAEAPRAKAALESEAYIVPLGAFTQPENAKLVRDKASSAGIKSYTETIKVAQGQQTRVRAGPFSSRDAAEKARQKLKSLGVEVGRVAQK